MIRRHAIARYCAVVQSLSVRFTTLSTMTDQVVRRTTKPAAQTGQAGWGALLLGLAILGLLWVLSTPDRENYVPNALDITILIDGLLLAPGAHWTDWFTHGYSHFFDRYREWPSGITAFTRPAFQFVIYLAQFAFGR